MAAAQPAAVSQIALPSPAETPPRLFVEVKPESSSVPKICPKYGWEYPWSVLGKVRVRAEDNSPTTRFRIFSQVREQDIESDDAVAAARLLARLWEFNYEELRLDHSETYDNQLVEVYLAEEGKPGGEQLFTVDEHDTGPFGRARKVNLIYIYHLETFVDPLEKAREVAHEYGHATLPPVGRYTAPEAYANGFLGERIYLTWALEQVEDGELEPADFMGASRDELARYQFEKVQPLVKRVALNGPNLGLLAGDSSNAMDEFLGTAMYFYELMGPRRWMRGMRLASSIEAPEIHKGLLEAFHEQPTFEIEVPEYLRSEERVWIPLPPGGKVSNADALKRQGDWVLIRPKGATVGIHNVSFRQS
ncbi:MAG: hypothetical protein ACOCX1_00670 [Fimbriimonadaceae bacterium]